MSKVILNKDDLPSMPLFLEGISFRYFRENKVIPIEINDTELKIVMAEPENSFVKEALEWATSRTIKVFSAEMALKYRQTSK